MAWVAPPTVATGDIYTAAMFNTYTRDNPNHLRALLGGADPGVVNRVPVSNAADSAIWTTVPDEAMTNQKVDKVSTIYTTFAAATASKCGFAVVYNPGSTVVDGPEALPNQWYLMQVGYPGQEELFIWQFTKYVHDNTKLWQRSVINGSAGNWTKVWHSENDGTDTGLNADVLRGYIPSNASGQLPVNNGSVNTSLISDMVDGFHAGNASGQVPVSNTLLNANLVADFLGSWHAGNASGQIPVSNNTNNVDLIADKVDGFHAGNSSGQVPVSNDTLNVNLNADKVDGFHAGNAGGQVPVSNGSLNVNLNADLLDNLDGTAFAKISGPQAFTALATFAGTQGAIIVKADYVGSASDRNVTTGFAPKLVIITAPDAIYILSSTSIGGYNFRIGNGTLQVLSETRLDASNGFNLSNNAGEANNSGVTYTYIAIG